MNSAELVYDTSNPPICSGISGSILNCSSGCSSSATSIFLSRPAETDRRALSGDRAIDGQHAGRDPEKEQHDHRERPRAQHAIDRPTQPHRDGDRDHELDADAETDPKRLLLTGGIAGLR